MSRKYRWTVTSPVSSGWKAVASCLPFLTATGVPSNSQSGTVPSPNDTTIGARMNSKGISPSPAKSALALKLPS